MMNAAEEGVMDVEKVVRDFIQAYAAMLKKERVRSDYVLVN